jgi:hypothetical protein
VDVSETIRARYYRPQQAALRQMRPGTIIDTAESYHQSAQAHIIGVGTIGSAIGRGAVRVVPVEANVATSAVKVGDYEVDPWVLWAKVTKAALEEKRVQVDADLREIVRRPAADAKPALSAAADLRGLRRFRLCWVFRRRTLPRSSGSRGPACTSGSMSRRT